MDEATLQGDLASVNARLKEISQVIYGERAELRVADPKSIRLLKHNARYMKRPVFEQLTANIQDDGMLSSVPLCHELADEALECLSGNHRIKGAIQAGLDRVLVLVIPHQENAEKISRQLSHNALVGQDDQQTLSRLWKELKTLDHRLYAGLDSETMEEFDRVAFQGLSADQLPIERVVMWFLPEEVERLDDVLKQCSEVASSDHLYLGPLAKYEALWKALVAVKKLQNIKNTAVAFMVLLDKIEQTRAGGVDESTPADQAGGGGAIPSSALLEK